MQFQVPQFVETEDKIVGPLTLKQFIYIAAAGGVSMMLYPFLQLWLWCIVSLPLIAIGIGLAFIKVGGRTLPVIARAAFYYVWKPQTYVWQPQAQPQATSDQRPATSGKPAGLSLEELLSGFALQRTWQKLQTGGKISPEFLFGKSQERYTVFRKKSGERAVARRIDYR